MKNACTRIWLSKEWMEGNWQSGTTKTKLVTEPTYEHKTAMPLLAKDQTNQS
jgi:hypothetical protein